MNHERQVRIVIYSLFLILIAFVLFLVFNQKITPGTYTYYNGFSTFDIHQFKDELGVTYQIKVFINNDPAYIYTRHEPKEVENVNVENVRDKILDKDEIFITIDPLANLTGRTTIAALEIDKILDNSYLYGIPVQSAFTQEYQDYPIKTCESSNQTSGVIELRLGEQTRIFSENDCIILESPTEDGLILLSNALIFHVMDIVRY